MTETFITEQTKHVDLKKTETFLRNLDPWRELQKLKKNQEFSESIMRFEEYFLNTIMPTVVMDLVYKKGNINPLDEQPNLDDPEIYPKLKDEIEKCLAEEISIGINTIKKSGQEKG